MPNRHRDQEQRKCEALADAIMRRRDDIATAWLEQISRSVARDDVSPTELRNSMPEYLERLADGLRDAATAQAGGSSAWENVAREHAETRVRLGFDIDQLVREFIVLRQVIFRVLEEEGVLVEIGQASSVADLIEGAIVAAVTSYVASRDFELRRQSAEHVGFMTHELRNPLTTAMLGTAHLRRSLSVAPEHLRMFDVVERNQHRLAELIDGALLLARDAHALRPKLERIQLATVIGDTVASAKVTAEAKGLHVEAHVDPGVIVDVDPKLTTSALENVVLNAVKYTDEGEVSVDVEEHASEVIVHVRDSGPGLSSEELRTIFEPFRRGRHGGKAGSGLGLAIARRAMESQGGSIHAESPEGRGCHFWLTLPKARP